MTPVHPPQPNRPWQLPLAAVAVSLAAITGWLAISAERSRSVELGQRQDVLAGSLTKASGQLEQISRRLAVIEQSIASLPPDSRAQGGSAAEPEPAKAAAAPLPRPAAQPPGRPAPAPRDPRLDHLQARVAGQEKELASTRNDIAQARQDLEGRLGATRDELSTSIARTQEELAELRKRGEKNYYEFVLLKNKDFSRAGPLALSLRKADTKRGSYNLKLRVDDRELEKKNVILFEPLLITTPDRSRPIELVVNEITRDRVRGYVGEPRQPRPVATRIDPQAPALQSRQ